MNARNAVIVLLAALLAGTPAAAFTPSDAVKASVVVVICDGRKGSGVVTDGVGGFVVTSGHIAVDISTGTHASQCTVTFPVPPSFTAFSRHAAEVAHAVFDAERGVDFAVLRLGRHLSGPSVDMPSGLAVDVVVSVGDAVAVLGYPQSTQTVQVSEGTVTGFERGLLLSDAPIREGNSGGPATNEDGDVVGISTYARYTIDEATGEQVIIDYGFGDVAGLVIWLDIADPILGHAGYLRHADEAAYRAKPYFIRDEAASGCDELVRTQASTTVYCLRTGGRRAAFPDEATYFSWFDGFDDVVVISASNLAEFRLTGLVTHRQGTLVKIQSDPRVYLATDAIGTLRWIPTEAMAIEYFGADWATKVVDVPESFFPSYVVGAPLE